VPEFQGKMRLTANPFDLVKAGIDVSEGNLALIVSDHEIGEWPLAEVSIDVDVDGFHVRVDGENFVFTTSQADAFAEAVGVARPRISKGGKAKTAKHGGRGKAAHSKRAVPTQPTQAVTPAEITTPAKAPPPVVATKIPRSSSRSRLRALIGRVDISSSRGRITLGILLTVITLAVLARPVLAGILLFIGMAAVLLIGAAVVDPLIASRLPDRWPPSRLVLVALTVIVSGLLLVAF